MSSRRIRRVGAGLATLLAAACTFAGCATGSDDTLPDGDAVGLDGSVAHDGHVGDSGISFNDATFPGVDGSSHGDDAGSGDDSGTGDDASPSDDSGGPTDDSGTGDDSGTDSSTMCPPGMTGPGCADCATGFHLCGATCTADETNDPSVGCSQSCGGGACAAMTGETASCSTAGQCTYSCATQCCSDSDCSGSTPNCVGGTCQGATCSAPSGECSGVCTDLTTNENCGSCGTDCPDSVECLASSALGFPLGCDCTDEGGGDYECE